MAVRFLRGRGRPCGIASPLRPAQEIACDRYTLTADGAVSAKERAGYKEFRCNVDIGAKTVQEIVDRTEIENIPTAEALEEFYADESYRYYFPSMKSEYVCVRFTDGTETTVAAALNKGWITLADLGPLWHSLL